MHTQQNESNRNKKEIHCLDYKDQVAVIEDIHLINKDKTSYIYHSIMSYFTHVKHRSISFGFLMISGYLPLSHLPSAE